MKRKINLAATFFAIRELPPEVSFLQVKNWVEQQPPKPFQSRHWLTAWLSKKHFLN